MMNQHHQSFMQNLYVQINKQKILSLFRTKGQQNVDPFEYLTQYCKVKMALMIESIYISKLWFLFRLKYTRFMLNLLNQDNQYYPLQKVKMKKAKQKIKVKLKTFIHQILKIKWINSFYYKQFVLKIYQGAKCHPRIKFIRIPVPFYQC